MTRVQLPGLGLGLLGAGVVAGGVASAGPLPVDGVKRAVLDKSAAMTPPPPAFEVSAPTISAYDPTTCKVRWDATVKNIGSTTAVPLSVQASGTKNGVVVGSGGGTSVDWMAKGQSSTHGMSADPYTFRTLGIAAPTHFAIELLSNGTRLATSLPTPLPPIPSLADTVTLNPSPVTDVWSLTLKNTGAAGYPTIGLSVQSYASNSATGPWDASGGPGIPSCLPPQKDVIVSGHRLADHRYLKIEIRRVVYTVDRKIESNTLVWERVLDSVPVPKAPIVAPRTLVKQ